MSKFNEILSDVIILIKALVYGIYALSEALVRNLIPSQYLKKSVKGDNVLITGAAGGIGKLLTREFLQLGANVICVDLNESLLKDLEEDLKNDFAGKRMAFYSLDVSSSEMVKKVANKIKAEVGKVDILINNAGIVNQGKLFLELTEEDVKKIFNINALSHFWLCREFLPDMINANSGHIVNVSSVCGIIGGYRLTDYCASKFAVLGFTESLRSELRIAAPSNKIVVSAVCPFHIKTKMFQGADITCMKWLNLSMEPQYAAETIVEGVLLNKELIFIPKVAVHIFGYIKYMFPTKCQDYLMKTFKFGESMNRMSKSH